LVPVTKKAIWKSQSFYCLCRIKAENLHSKEVINEKVVLISPPAFDLPEKVELEEILDHKFVIWKLKLHI